MRCVIVLGGRRLNAREAMDMASDRHRRASGNSTQVGPVRVVAGTRHYSRPDAGRPSRRSTVKYAQIIGADRAYAIRDAALQLTLLVGLVLIGASL